MSARTSRAALRDLLQAHCQFPASVHDPISMRAAHQLGYAMAMFAGSVASQVVLASPDLVLIDLGELASQVRRLCRASDLPLLVDADHGYGNAWHVRRCVEELEVAGAAAITLEDSDLPPVPGATGKSRLISLEDGLAKMQAAVSARRDDMLIVARTSAPLITGLEDAIRRLSAYEKTGVDALFVVGLRQWDELDALRQHLRLPLMLGGASETLSSDPDRLSRLGVRVCLLPHLPYAAAVAASYHAMAMQRSGESTSGIQTLGKPDMDRLLDAQRYV